MHNSVRSTIHYVFPVCADANSAHFFPNGYDFDIIKVIELKLTTTTVPGTLKCSCILQDNNSASDSDSDCILLEEPKKCQAPVIKFSKVTNATKIFFVSYIVNPGTKKFPKITESTITINECRYRLSGIVYLNSSHFWCEVYSCQRNYKKGWYT